MATSLRVLLIEDSEDDAQVLLRELRQGGYAPTAERVDSAAALRRALAGRTFDLVICEWVVPQLAALAALAEVRARAPDLPVIIVTRQVGEEIAVSAMKAGAHDVVSKDRLARLAPAVERELADAEVRRARRQAAGAARESAERLRLLVEHTPAAVAMFDRDMRYLAHSRRWLSDYRLGERDLVGRSHYEVFPDLPEHWRRVHARCLAGAIERCEEEVFPRADGRVDWVRWEVRPWSDGRGEIGGLIALTEVITERKRAEATLRESEERHRDLIENINDAIFEVDAQGTIAYMSPVLGRMSQFTAEEVLGRPFIGFVHPEDLPRLADSFAKTLRGEYGPTDYRVVDKDGSLRWVRTSSRLVRDGDRVVGLRGVLSDISAQKEAEEAYRVLVENALQGLVIVQDGRFVFANRAFEEITGAPSATVTGAPLTEWVERFVHPADRPGVLAGLASWIPGRGEIDRREVRLRAADGRERWVLTLTAELHYRGRLATQILFADITERRRAEDAVRQLNLELEARVRERTAVLEATAKELEAFSYSVSHDLRAPLRAIDGFTQVVLEDWGADMPVACADYLRRVRVSTRRMGELIDQLLVLSRVMRSEPQCQPVDLGALAREVAAEIARAEPTRLVTLAIADGLTAYGDPALLRAVLGNLLGNAWKFTRPRAEARIEVGACPGIEPRAFYVHDNGVGFEMQYVEKLFRAFQRLHGPDEFDGSGIGLATVARIVQRHGGRVWAEGAVGEGATFYFTLGG